VAGLDVGGLSAQQAESELRSAIARPVGLRGRGQTLLVDPGSLARPRIRRAVRRALHADVGQAIRLHVEVWRARVSAYATIVDRRVCARPMDAKVLGLHALRPRISRARLGCRIVPGFLERVLARRLRGLDRSLIRVPTERLAPPSRARTSGRSSSSAGPPTASTCTGASGTSARCRWPPDERATRRRSDASPSGRRFAARGGIRPALTGPQVSSRSRPARVIPLERGGWGFLRRGSGSTERLTRHRSAIRARTDACACSRTRPNGSSGGCMSERPCSSRPPSSVARISPSAHSY
jgi:hypothetical protein